MISSLHLAGEVEEFYSVKKMTSVIIDQLELEHSGTTSNMYSNPREGPVEYI